MAKRVIEKFVAEMSADDTKFKRSLKRSGDDAQAWSRKVRSSLNVGIKIATAAAVTSLVVLVKKSSEAIDAQAKLADAVGLTTEQFAGYEIGAALSGIQMSQFNTGVTRMLRTIGDAEDGLSTATLALSKLGLEAADLKNLDTDAQIKLIADRFSEMGNTVDRTSVLLNIFGRSGLSMGTLLKQGSEGINIFQRDAEALGLAFTRIDAAKVELANDALELASFVATAAGRSLSVELAPIILAVTKHFIEAAKESGGMGKAIVGAVETALTPIGWLADGVHAIILAWQGVSAAALTTLSTIAKIQTFQARGLVAAADLVGADESLKPLRRIVAGVDSLSAEAKAARAKFSESLLEPLPTQKMKTLVDQARKDANELAKEIADSVGGGGDDTGGSVDTGPSPAELARREAAKAQAEQERKVLEARGQSLRESVLKPNELYIEQLAELDALLASAVISQETYNRKQLEYKAALDESLGVTDQYEEAMRLVNEALDPLDVELQAIADSQSLLNKALIAGQINAEQFALAMAPLDQKMIELQTSVEDSDESISVFADQAARNIQDSLGNAINDLIQGTEDWEKSFIRALLNIVSQAAASDLLAAMGLSGAKGGNLGGLATAVGGLFGGKNAGGDAAGDAIGKASGLVADTDLCGGPGQASGGGISGIFKAATSLFGGFFADGGRPDPGKVSVVGERGPELFVPDGVGGNIVPMGDAKMQSQNVNVNAVTVLDANSIASAMGAREMGSTFLNHVKIRRSDFRAAMGLGPF